MLRITCCLPHSGGRHSAMTEIGFIVRTAALHYRGIILCNRRNPLESTGEGACSHRTPSGRRDRQFDASVRRPSIVFATLLGGGMTVVRTYSDQFCGVV